VCPKIVRGVCDSVPRGGCATKIASAGHMAAPLLTHSRNLQGTRTRAHTHRTQASLAVLNVVVSVHVCEGRSLVRTEFLSVAGKRWGVVIQGREVNGAYRAPWLLRGAPTK